MCIYTFQMISHMCVKECSLMKAVEQGCILSPCLFNFYAEHIMQYPGLDDLQAGISIAGEISITSYMQMKPPLWQKVKN